MLHEREGSDMMCQLTRLWLSKDQRVVVQDLQALEMPAYHSTVP